AELVDARDLGSRDESLGGSSPSARTTPQAQRPIFEFNQRQWRRRDERRQSMQVTETLADGLKREYQVLVPATELATKVSAPLQELKTQVRINGFRPGKVPVAHLKRLYGRGAMAEAIEAAVRDANAKIVTDGGFKLATEPKVTLPTEQGAIDNVIAGKADLSYTV